MMSYFKKHLPLFVALALPLVMVFFIAGEIYLPRFFSHPQTDFIYTTGYDYCGTQYFVQYQKITKSEGKCSSYGQEPFQEYKLFIHNTKENTSKQISIVEAETYTLDESAASPEGYRIEYGNQSGGFFPFFIYSGADYNTVYLTKSGVSYKLNLSNNAGPYSSNQFKFLGWIKNK